MTHQLDYRPLPDDLPWDGAVNARWITGVFYRMGRHEWLTDQGWDQLRAAGVEQVIDLRNPQEIKRREHDPDVGIDALKGVRLRNLPLELPGNLRFESVAQPYMNHPRLYSLVCVEFGEQLRQVFQALSTAKSSMMIHCSAGRDRSGLVASLLLDLAGKGDQILLHDELAVRGINEWHRVSPRKHPYESHRDENELHQIIQGRAAELTTFMSWLGSAREYLAEVGVGEQALDALEYLATRPRGDGAP